MAMSMSMSSPSLSRADLDTALARVTSKPNVIGALVLARETGAIIRSTLADDELAKKYSLGVKRIPPCILKALIDRIIAMWEGDYEGY
jgi:hypothetical protein